MDKKSVLQSIAELSSKGLLKKEEMLSAFESQKIEESQDKSSLFKDVGLAEMMYFIGALIVAIGIGVLIFQNWAMLNTVTKILTTLGFGIVAYIVGVILNKEEKYGAVGYAFHLIGALVIPTGIAVTFYEAGIKVDAVQIQATIGGILTLLYLISYFIFKKSLFTFFTIIYASWFFIAITDLLVGGGATFSNLQFYEFRILVLGLSYMSLAYYFSMTTQRGLSGFLYGFGSHFTLLAIILLSGWGVSGNIFWELAMPFAVAGILYLSVKLKRRSLLTFGTIYLMAYILKITGEYFSQTLGWSFSLIFSGLMLIGVGYYAFTLGKRYISKSE